MIIYALMMVTYQQNVHPPICAIAQGDWHDLIGISREEASLKGFVSQFAPNTAWEQRSPVFQQLHATIGWTRVTFSLMSLELDERPGMLRDRALEWIQQLLDEPMITESKHIQ